MIQKALPDSTYQSRYTFLSLTYIISNQEKNPKWSNGNLHLSKINKGVSKRTCYQVDSTVRHPRQKVLFPQCLKCKYDHNYDLIQAR